MGQTCDVTRSALVMKAPEVEFNSSLENVSLVVKVMLRITSCADAVTVERGKKTIRGI